MKEKLDIEENVTCPRVSVRNSKTLQYFSVLGNEAGKRENLIKQDSIRLIWTIYRN